VRLRTSNEAMLTRKRLRDLLTRKRRRKALATGERRPGILLPNERTVGALPSLLFLEPLLSTI
jgi:hypothetical protein